jgi:transcription-repair coupling factor (superfamily II helicase)
MAAELLQLQAQRRGQFGIQIKPDSVWQQQFEASFPYEETPDQLTAIAAFKKDMTSPNSHGETGLRRCRVRQNRSSNATAFKAVKKWLSSWRTSPHDGPRGTTLRRFGNGWLNFRSKSPSSIDSNPMPNKRKRSDGSQTAKSISSSALTDSRKNVQFFNLGLLIIDEEQKFGVELKERIKKAATQVDVLTLSATPIPRTLHMSLVGIRDVLT